MCTNISDYLFLGFRKFDEFQFPSCIDFQSLLCSYVVPETL